MCYHLRVSYYFIMAIQSRRNFSSCESVLTENTYKDLQVQLFFAIKYFKNVNYFMSSLNAHSLNRVLLMSELE